MGVEVIELITSTGWWNKLIRSPQLQGPSLDENYILAFTSLPAPGRKLFTVMVRPGAGNGASITLRMNGWTRAGDISRLFSTSSNIYIKKIAVTCLVPFKTVERKEKVGRTEIIFYIFNVYQVVCNFVYACTHTHAHVCLQISAGCLATFFQVASQYFLPRMRDSGWPKVIQLTGLDSWSLGWCLYHCIKLALNVHIYILQTILVFKPS